MEAGERREKISRLVEDLTWLQDNLDSHSMLEEEPIRLRLGLSILRNLLGPVLNGQSAEPLHLSVIGGAGTGKSTVSNFLIGSVAADANPQAGFTRHPIAYVSGSDTLSWTSHLGFLGPLKRIDEVVPASLDEDVYQIRRPGGLEDSPLGSIAIWDCPDVTTFASAVYRDRVLEILGLSDLVVFVASDERYNDAVPTRFLEMVLQSGKPVVVVLTKMKPEDGPTIREHFRNEVLGKFRIQRSDPMSVPVITIPFLTIDERNDPVEKAKNYRIALLNQVLALISDPRPARLRVVSNGWKFLRSISDRLMELAKPDLQALEAWQKRVDEAVEQIEQRYYQEYLVGESFQRLDDARDRLLDSLEIPGAGKVASYLLKFLRFPYLLLRSALGKAFEKRPLPGLAEIDVLESGYRAAIDQLRSQTLQGTKPDRMTQLLQQGFSGGLLDTAKNEFRDRLDHYRQMSQEDLDANTRQLAGGLTANPSLLGSFRAGKLFIDATAVLLGVYLSIGVIGVPWTALIIVPIFASVTHQIVEWIVGGYAGRVKEIVRDRRLTLVRQAITQPFARWLKAWPLTGGSRFERMQQILQRFPTDIKDLDKLIQAELTNLQRAAVEEKAHG
jgi:hypothetical protein